MHAGENKKFPKNVREAIVAGATRIGHGIYGVDEETLKMAIEKNIIFEINTGSNSALGYINKDTPLPILHYLDSGLRVSIGTDGDGVFMTNKEKEMNRLKMKKLKKSDFEKIYKSDASYLKEISGMDRIYHSGTTCEKSYSILGKK